MSWRIIQGDCVERMAELDEASVDAVVCDPPYGLEFMGKEWDRIRPEYGNWNDNKWAGDGLTRKEGVASEGRPSGVDSLAGATPSLTYKANLRCRRCKHWQRGGRPCVCETPDWAPRANERAVAMQDWHEAWAREALRVLKPGGHLLAFGGTRTSHRLACAIEDAGFEIRDTICWLYGSGFPKSLDVSKAIDKANGRRFEDRYALGRHIRECREAAGLSQGQINEWFGYRDGCQHWERQDASGARVPTLADWGVLTERLSLSDEFLSLVEREEAEREKVGERVVAVDQWTAEGRERHAQGEDSYAVPVTAPATPEAERWQGWGTALKPAHEPIVVARKPLAGTVAQNVLAHGTGALNVDGTRIDAPGGLTNGGSHSGRGPLYMSADGDAKPERSPEHGFGRWPANVVLDEEAARLLDEQTGELPTGTAVRRHKGGSEAGMFDFGQSALTNDMTYGDSGGASRFFYVAKASRMERNAGLEGFEERDGRTMDGGHVVSEGRTASKVGGPRQNHHPTVKPISLMRWLVRLVTPPGGTVLDPFAGSGTTGIASVFEGFDFIGIEREPEYVEIAEARIAWWDKHRGDGEAAEILRAGEERDAVEATGQLGLEL